MPFKGEIISNTVLKGGYHRIEFDVPDVCAKARPGQFAHVRIAGLRDKVLRRPFSIFNAGGDGVLTVIYKKVGAGTDVLSKMKPGEACGVMGPLGKPYTLPGKDDFPVIIAGGYGSAGTYFLAKKCPSPGLVIMGARTADDVILEDEFKALGFEVRISTNDGSAGKKGLTTDLLSEFLNGRRDRKLKFYGCGPRGMLEAAAKMLTAKGLGAELSMDHLMCCGVGACFACVVKVRDPESPDGWRYARTCNEGPVFNATELKFD
jgi:dihydroorotate dehydrogenase electron transfer subunit